MIEDPSSSPFVSSFSSGLFPKDKPFTTIIVVILKVLVRKKQKKVSVEVERALTKRK